MSRANKKSIASALMIGYLGCTALVMPSNPAFAAQTVSAKSSWSVSRVASIAQGNYCTMAQKYDNNAILSFARSVNGEYSLAMDFQSPVFSGSEENISVQAGNGQSSTYKVTPQSQQVAVISLGRDEEFFKALESSQKLNIKFSGADLSFKTDRFKDGKSELVTCLSGLNKPAASATEQTAQAPSPSPSSSKTDSYSVEGLLAARPNPSMGAEPISSLETSAPVAKVEAQAMAEMAPAASSMEANYKAERQIQELSVENAQLKRALAESRQNFENQIAQAQGAAVSETKEKLVAAQSENNQLKGKIAELENSLETLSKQNGEVTKAAQEIEAQKTRAQQLTQNIETLKAENSTLKNQLEIVAQAGTSDEAEQGQKIAALQSENAKLKSTITELEQQTAQLSQMMESSNGEEGSDQEELKAKLSNLTSENRALKSQLEQMTITANQATALAASAPKKSGSEGDLHQEIRALKNQIETITGEKVALQASYEKLQKESEVAGLKSAGGSWDLEQATRRYQESQREIRRMGAMLDDQRLKCTAEKKEIELMLFDPEIAESSQIAKLNSLEQQVTERESKIAKLQAELAAAQAMASPEKDQKISSLEQQMTEREGQIAKLQKDLQDTQSKASSSAEKDQQISSLQSRLSGTEARLSEAISMREALQQQLSSVQSAQADKEIKETSLNDKITALEKAVAEKSEAAQSLAAQVIAFKKTAAANQMEAQELAKKEADIKRLEAQLAERNAKLASLEERLTAAENMSQQIQASKTAEKSNEALIATLKEDLVIKSSQLGERDAKLVQMQSQVSQLEAQLKATQQQNAKAMAQQASYVQPSYGSEVSQGVTPNSSVSVFPSAMQYQTVLSNAGVPIVGGISEVNNGNNSETYRAYSWKTQSLYGSVEMRQVSNIAAYEGVISQYLSRAKSRCDGEFAAVPSSTKANAAEMSKSYEIACVGQESSSSASVLFTFGKGIVSTIAHEGRAEAMDLAIDARDRVARTIR